MSTSLDGDYLAVQYCLPKTIHPKVDEGDTYPKIDIFLVQKATAFSLTYIR